MWALWAPGPQTLGGAQEGAQEGFSRALGIQAGAWVSLGSSWWGWGPPCPSGVAEAPHGQVLGELIQSM